MKKYKVNVNGTSYEIEIELMSETEASQAPSAAAAPAAAPAPTPVAAPAGEGEKIASPMPGTILDVKVAVGDTVKLYGVMGQYNGTAQMENAWAIEITPAGSGNQGGGSPDTNDNVAAYIAVAVVALFGIAYVSKKH